MRQRKTRFQAHLANTLKMSKQALEKKQKASTYANNAKAHTAIALYFVFKRLF